MTEHEKMLAGKIYDPFSEGMAEERERAHLLCRRYNALAETDPEREAVLRELIPEAGEGVYLQGPIWFDFGVNTKIGRLSYANFNFTVLDEGRVEIGESVFMGPNVSLLTPIHPLRWQDRNSFFNRETGAVTNMERTGPIVIGDNCWIGGSVTVCGGVTIGEGCVIGAGAVVVRDIPANTFAAGVPCVPVREITEADSLLAHPELFADPEDMRFFGKR
ncbi:MAG: sugar O-acetyltransferase [Abditibacteriota bacterium]|nr:sugar O-acetyltransferase [Abditibacteriota bacterium]